MPKDDWARSRNKQIAKRINRETAQEREDLEALWLASGGLTEGSDSLASEVLYESEWTICKHCNRKVQFSRYDEHMYRTHGELTRRFVGSDPPQPVNNLASRNPTQIQREKNVLPKHEPVQVGNTVRVGNFRGKVTAVKGNKITVDSGTKVKKFDLDSTPRYEIVGSIAPDKRRKNPKPSPQKQVVDLDQLSETETRGLYLSYSSDGKSCRIHLSGGDVIKEFSSPSIAINLLNLLRTKGRFPN